METYTNRKLLLSELITVDSVLSQFGISSGYEMAQNSTVFCEVMDDSKKQFLFNHDISYEFIDLEQRKRMKMEYSSAMSSTHPLVVMGPNIYVAYAPKESLLVGIDFMFGTSLPIKYYRRYITAFNEKLESISDNGYLTSFPTNRRKKQGYLRFWVFKERMTALFYLNDNLPRYDCDIEEYYRHDDCGVNLLKDNGKIVAIDGWMKIPDDLQVKSDMRLVICKEQKLASGDGF